MNGLSDFWGALGEASFSVEGDESLACGTCDGVSLGAAAFTNMDATEAMSRSLAKYVELSVQGEALRQMLVAKAKIPCEVWAAYAAARQDYLTKSQEIFDQLASKGVTVEQVVYSMGKPVMETSDPNKVKTLRVQAPLRPPSFVGLDCPGLPVMNGANFAGAIGWESMPISLGFIPVAAAGAVAAACTAATAGACLVLIGAGALVLGIAGYAGYKIMQQVAVAVREYESSPAKTVAAYTACFQNLVKGGVAPDAAVKQCQGSQTSAQQYAVARGAQDAAGGFGFWAWLGVGAAALVVGGIVIRALRSRVAAAAALVSPIPVGAIAGPARRRRRRACSDDSIALGEVRLHPRRRY